MKYSLDLSAVNMNEDYLHFLKYKKKPSPTTLDRYLEDLEILKEYIRDFKNDKEISKTTPQDIEDFLFWLKEKDNQRAFLCCKGIAIYFEFLKRYDLQAKTVNTMWELNEKPLSLYRILNKPGWTVWFLSQKGIINVQDMLKYGDTKEKRESLAEVLEVPVEEITELVKIAELTRIPGLKRKRARLFYNAGLDTLEKIANSTTKEIIEKTSEYIEKHNFKGWPPERKEAEEAINIAKYLESRIID